MVIWSYSIINRKSTTDDILYRLKRKAVREGKIDRKVLGKLVKEAIINGTLTL